PGTGTGLDLQRIDGADVEAFRGRALKARLLMELTAVRVCGLDHRRDLGRRVVEDADPRHVGEALVLVLVRADHFARQAADAERRVGKDDALRGLGRLRGRAVRDAEAADRFERDERDDRRGRCLQEAAAGWVRWFGRLVHDGGPPSRNERSSGKVATLTSGVNRGWAIDCSRARAALLQ